MIIKTTENSGVEEWKGSSESMTMGLECVLEVVRALGMGSCLSFRDGTSGGGVGLRRNSSIEELLRQFPGRKFFNGVTDAASLFTMQGNKGVNQDAMIVWENFGSKADTIFCGVFDGHGPNGHMVSKRVRDALPIKLIAQLASSDCRKDRFQALKESFRKAFKFMDKELKLHPNIDCISSGTTAVTLVKQGQDLVIGNVGDSRAVLGTKDKDNSFIAVQLTVDLKPNLPRENRRIRRCKGRVFALRNEPEVHRVWMPNNNLPGLAMARAFGDFCLKDFGLISVPEISYHRLTDKDEFVVLATDGVWDVLSNKEVVDIVASASRSSAARVLVDSAVRGWNLKYPTSKVDDCAVVCLYLNSNSYDSCSSKPEKQAVKS